MRLTDRQYLVLKKIYDYLLRNGYPPSIRELAQMLDINSPRGVFDHLRSLEKKEYIERKSSARSIKLTKKAMDIFGQNTESETVRLPLIGRIAAGSPVFAVENIEDRIPFSADILNGTADFALRVRGDSMIGDHILDGDIIAVRSRTSADNGDIVVALIGEEAVVKRFYKNGDSIELRSSNPGYAPIKIIKELVIQGIVVAVQRTI